MTHFLQRTALIALASGAIGACATEPMGPAPTAAKPAATPAPTPAPAPAQPAVPAGEAPIAVAPAAPVEQRQLDVPAAPRAAPAPTTAAPTPPTPAPATARPAPAPVQGAPAVQPPAPTYRTVTTRTVTGRVIEVEGSAQTYRVRKGDTLDEIADRFGVSLRELRELNGLHKRAKIRPGQVIKGPRSQGRAYVAGQGDTLYAVARRFSVTPAALSEENDLPRDGGLRPGQRLRLPAGARDRGPQVTSTRVRVDGPEPQPDVAQAAPRPQPQTQAQGPAFRTVTTRSVTGRVVEVAGPAATYRVRKGDNLTEVADNLGISVEDLRDLNGLTKRHSTIRPGQVLKGPPSRARAYVAVQGDTLLSIGRRFGVSAEAVRDENGLNRNAPVRSGQTLRLPDGYRDHGPLTSTVRVPIPGAAEPAYTPPPRVYTPPAYTPPAPRPQASFPAPQPAMGQPTTAQPTISQPTTSQPAPQQPAPRPYTPPAYTPPAPRPQPAPRPYTPRTYAPPPANGPAFGPTTAPTPGDEQISALGRGRFVWPVQGSILSDFGAKPTGQRNDGVNISASVGASVRAAAAGDVVYAGDQVPGFGNLVLIKHPDGWVTAYGHLSRVMVKMQQKVAQGQEIGLAGATGGVSEPQLHFEIRFAPSPLERAKPIDPKLVLPR